MRDFCSGMRRGDLETRYPLGRDAPAQVTEEQVLHPGPKLRVLKTWPAPRYLLLKAGWGAYCKSSVRSGFPWGCWIHLSLRSLPRDPDKPPQCESEKRALKVH